MIASSFRSSVFGVLAVGLAGFGVLQALELARSSLGSGSVVTAHAAPPDETEKPAAHDGEGDHDGAGDDAADDHQGDDHHNGQGGQGHSRAKPAKTAPEECPAVTLAERAGITRSEMSILSSLSERRRALDQREAELDIRVNYVAAAETRLETRVNEIKAVRAEVEGLLGELEQAQQVQVDALVKLYETMKPEVAANILPGLDDDVRLSVATGLKDKTLAAILGMMTQDQAIDLTMAMARRYGTPTDLDQPLVTGEAE